ncbi:Aste57867_19860 [Aphanomyces stellatus]|uniref:Aste57867_19860 protein n=1 Tax=Aphanomyces stellatus TaxID=120398 RepID=A0A485LDM7_9STRA|nr:hypothetical protein As57867_019794 [Aphanomyces stellatus]VFT96558.1 Aste57867_19860 [Aphanomyces stellatus]
MVSTILVVDIWLSAYNVGLASNQASQVHDWFHFGVGCAYGTRVWFAYWTMRCVTILVKRWRWEHRFASVDPGLFSNSILSAMFHAVWPLYLPPADRSTTIEVLPVVLGVIWLIGSFPLAYAASLVWLRPSHSTSKLVPPLLDRDSYMNEDATPNFASAVYNDMKIKVLWFWVTRCTEFKRRAPAIGGTLHTLSMRIRASKSCRSLAFAQPTVLSSVMTSQATSSRNSA